MPYRILPYLLLIFILPVSVSAQQYWQQEVNYKIEVTLDDENHSLSATEELEYINHSPETLTFLYFHLWPNAYKDRSTAFAKQQIINDDSEFHFAPESARGFMTGLDFKVNGQAVKWEIDAKHPDIAKINLNQPLLPGARITISTPFKVKLPDSFSRLGHVGQAYQITQWYPKPAVFDQNGWHQMPYLDQGEFYSEFGSFDVRITLPANYTVGATGQLQNPEEIARMDSLAALTAAITEYDIHDMEFPESDAQTKTLRYLQDNIHDFAWFADKRYHVLKSEVVLPASQRPVTTWLLFTNRKANTWVNSVKDINDAVYYYSLWLGDYPYAHATAVDGALSAGSGMEYPMVTVTEPAAIIHEVGHNWFYGILGSNERQHPWLDEGVNTYYETRVKALRDPFAGMISGEFNSPMIAKVFGLENLPPAALDAQGFLSGASRGLDQPVTSSSELFRSNNYGMGVYLKTSYLFQYLERYLGTARFDSAMQAYFEAWKFKHPSPQNLQTVLEKETGESLDWFFKDLLPSTAIPDAKLKSVSKTSGGLAAVVKQTGKYALPVQVATLDAQGQVIESYWTKPNEREQTVQFALAEGVDRVVVDPEYLFPELDRRDNQYQMGKAFPKLEPLKLQMLAGVSRIDKQQIYFTPTIGYNTTDKFMLGAAFYNQLLTEHKLNYVVMPMFAFGSERLTGLADVRYRIPAEGFLRKVDVGVQGQRFANFHSISPSLTFHNRLTTANRPRQSIKLSWTYVKDDVMPTIHAPRVAYELKGKNALRGTNLMIDVTGFRYEAPIFNPIPEPFPQLSTQEKTNLRARFDLENWYQYKEGKEIKLRTFFGYLHNGNSNNSMIYLGLAGSPDYLKRTPFFNRPDLSHFSGGPASIRQTDRQDGGFRNPVPVFSQEWMAAVNLTADLPVTPFTVYLDLGRIQEINEVFYGTGLQWSMFNKALQIYFPLAGSNYQNNIPSSFKDFTQSIRYSLNLNTLNPFKLLEDLQ